MHYPLPILRSYIQFQDGWNHRSGVTPAQAMIALDEMIKEGIARVMRAPDRTQALLEEMEPLGGEVGPADYQVFVTKTVLEHFVNRQAALEASLAEERQERAFYQSEYERLTHE